MVPRENKNNAYAKMGGGGARSIMIFSEMDNFQWIYLKLCHFSRTTVSRELFGLWEELFVRLLSWTSINGST